MCQLCMDGEKWLKERTTPRQSPYLSIYAQGDTTETYVVRAVHEYREFFKDGRMYRQLHGRALLATASCAGCRTENKI